LTKKEKEEREEEKKEERKQRKERKEQGQKARTKSKDKKLTCKSLFSGFSKSVMISSYISKKLTSTVHLKSPPSTLSFSSKLLNSSSAAYPTAPMFPWPPWNMTVLAEDRGPRRQRQTEVDDSTRDARGLGRSESPTPKTPARTAAGSTRLEKTSSQVYSLVLSFPGSSRTM